MAERPLAPKSTDLEPATSADDGPELDLLRRRVADLERQLKRSKAAGLQTALGETLEERLALLSEAERVAGLGTWVWEPATGRVHWSDELFRLLGYDPDRDAASVERFFAAVHPDDRERVQETSARGVATGVAERVEFRVRRADGSVREVVMDGALLLDEAGAVARSVGTVLDVTRAREANRQLRAAQRLEPLAQLAAGVAHDFNNLLTAILGGATLARQLGDLGELDTVFQAAESGVHLTGQLLALARRSPHEPTVVQAGELLEDQRGLLQRTIHTETPLRVLREDAPWCVEVDPHDLLLAVLNLVANARDASPPHAEVTVAAGQVTDARGEWVAVTVSDRGSGIDPAQAEAVFEPFFTTKPLGQGTGLGLPMAAEVARKAGGRLTLAARPGGGTDARILLPRVEARPTTPLPKPAAAPPEARRLLLVEDDDRILRVLERGLAQAGYRVETADSVATARAAWAAADAPFDLLVTDLVLGDEGGAQLATELRQANPTLGVVCMTGYPPEDVDGELVPGCQFLRKPFALPGLLEAIAAADPSR